MKLVSYEELDAGYKKVNSIFSLIFLSSKYVLKIEMINLQNYISESSPGWLPHSKLESAISLVSSKHNPPKFERTSTYNFLPDWDS